MSDERTICLTLVRHGNTDANSWWLVDGNSDHSPLNARGKYEAQLVAKRLKNDYFDRVYSSELRRAFQTAAAIVRENISFNDETQIEKCDHIRERGFGVAESTMILKHRENAKKARVSLTNYVPEGGESDEEVRRRAVLFFKDLFAQGITSPKSYWNVLISSHGLIIREMIKCLVQDYGCTGISNKIMRDIRILSRTPNTGLTKFEVVLDKKSGHLIRGECTLFQCKRHLESENELVRKIESFKEDLIYYFEFFRALFLFFLFKFGLYS